MCCYCVCCVLRQKTNKKNNHAHFWFPPNVSFFMGASQRQGISFAYPKNNTLKTEGKEFSIERIMLRPYQLIHVLSQQVNPDFAHIVYSNI